VQTPPPFRLPTITVITGLDPVIHASIGANPGGGGRVDGRIKSGHDDRRVVKTLQDAPRPWMTAN
jgi:hypothetical protein